MGNGIFCVVVAFLRVLPNGRPHRVVLVHVVNVYLCKTRVSPTATRHCANPCTIGEVTDCASACGRCFSAALWQLVRAASAVPANKMVLTLRGFCGPGGNRVKPYRRPLKSSFCSCVAWRHSVGRTTAVQARVFASIARKTRMDSPPVTVNNPVRTSARLTNPKVEALVKTASKSVAAEELNRLIAQKASAEIPITIKAQPSPMKKAESNDSAGNREVFMCWTFWPHHLAFSNQKRFWRDF